MIGKGKKQPVKKVVPKEDKAPVEEVKLPEVKEEVKTETAPVKEEVEVKPEEGEVTEAQTYQGDMVISVEDKIVHGNLWKEVRCVKATYLLSKEDFERDVK